MNLNAYLKSLGSLTERERKLVIDAWIEATGVFDEGATRADELRNEVEGAGSTQQAATGGRQAMKNLPYLLSFARRISQCKCNILPVTKSLDYCLVHKLMLFVQFRGRA